jgi:hypothetical protein
MFQQVSVILQELNKIVDFTVKNAYWKRTARNTTRHFLERRAFIILVSHSQKAGMIKNGSALKVARRSHSECKIRRHESYNEQAVVKGMASIRIILILQLN